MGRIAPPQAGPGLQPSVYWDGEDDDFLSLQEAKCCPSSLEVGTEFLGGLQYTKEYFQTYFKNLNDEFISG